MVEPRPSTSLLQPAFGGPLEPGSRIMDGDAEPPIAADPTMISCDGATPRRVNRFARRVVRRLGALHV